MAARGANLCRVHGGSAPKVKAAAQRRFQQAADALTARLLGFALDQGVSDAIALQAVRDALDRAGLKAGVELDVTLKPYQQILDSLDGIEGGSRADYRRSVGAADDPPPAPTEKLALPPADSDAPIDAEIVDEGGELIAAKRSRVGVNSDAGPMTPDDAECVSRDCRPPHTQPSDRAALSNPAGGTTLTSRCAVDHDQRVISVLFRFGLSLGSPLIITNE